MKQIFIELENDIAIIKNIEPLYLTPEDILEFVIINNIEESDVLYFYHKNTKITVDNNKFILSYQEILDNMYIRITWYKKDTQPKVYMITELRVHEVKVVGRTVDERYPTVIQDLYGEIKDLKTVIVNLYNELENLKKVGVVQ